jgi:DnaK suppressor protein
MTNTELNAFRKILEIRKTDLENKSHNRSNLAIETSSDEMDRIQHGQERELEIGILDRNCTLARELRGALNRLDDGTFGVCVDCGEDINPKRLAAIPWVSYCIVCQDAADREQQAASRESTHLWGMAS